MFASLLSVADVCGGDWPRRAREAIVALMNEMTDEQPKVIILRHGLLLFDQLRDRLARGRHFNKELHRLSEPEFDWNRYRGASGLDLDHRPISISEQGRLLARPEFRSHSMWPPGLTAVPADAPGIASASSIARVRGGPSRDGARVAPVLRLVKPPAE